MKNFEQTPYQNQGPDLSKFILIFTNLFPVNDRPTGEEDEAFVYRLRQILDQIVTSKIPEEHQVGTVFSVLAGEARKVAAQIRSPHLPLKEFVHQLKEKLLFDHNIQQRKIADWNGITFHRFHQASSTTRKATTECIKHIFSHYEDLPDYMRNDHFLLQRLRDVLQNEVLCKTLFEKAEQNQTAQAFSKMLKTASSNHDRS